MMYRKGKIEAKGVVPHADGPVNTINDPAKFPNKGKFSGKTPANGVIDEAVGPVFTTNSTHIPTMNADKPAPESKQLKTARSTVDIKEHETTGDLTVSQRGSGEPTDRPYPLARSYEKKGKMDKIPNRPDR
jgi:hypothetical protein